jgi:hypothetical protein
MQVRIHSNQQPKHRQQYQSQYHDRDDLDRRQQDGNVLGGLQDFEAGRD